ncbi:dienelactone hydrolase family protein [Streptomonospora wellingtoniae]|uniref:Alpha/beta family hydrolase n=1 Tax=Streptomonospora wellingtoniae TaxID=3075544 RepID=A0ABU2KTB7_9ACTN|nr:alpha/beta family hydrolase [Streptomonospora sp. DSM 45055]MDT0302536.1 alpha/beta family hydrolase [Streptomonospora sp. DSM 45055]
MNVQTVTVAHGDAELAGDLTTVPDAGGVVLFAHGSGSSRHSPRNREVADALNKAGFATLLLDLLTEDEDRADQATRELRFDIGLLTRRLTAAVDWLARDARTAELDVGLFGASTGAAAALTTAADRPRQVGAVVARGGRVDLAEDRLAEVSAPVLMIAGSADEPIVRVSFAASENLHVLNEVHLVPDATHLFEEPGTLEQVAGAAMAWFRDHLGADRSSGQR